MHAPSSRASFVASALAVAACGSDAKEYANMVPGIAFKPVLTVGSKTIEPDAEGRYLVRSKEAIKSATLTYATPCGTATVTATPDARHPTLLEFPRDAFPTTLVMFDPGWTGQTIEHLDHTIEERIGYQGSNVAPPPRNDHYEDSPNRQALYLYFGECERALTIAGRKIPIPATKNTGGELQIVFVPKDPFACYRLDQVRYGSGGNCAGDATLTFQDADAHLITLGRGPENPPIFWFDRPGNTALSSNSCVTYRYFNRCP